MKKGMNFRTEQGQIDYFAAYDKSLKLWDIPFEEKVVETYYGDTHYLECGNKQGENLVLLHAASCGSTIWYKNVEELGKNYHIYAIDLLTESSKSLLYQKLQKPEEIAQWLEEVFDKLGLESIYLGGLSIGGWNSANYAIRYPKRVKKLVLLSPIQTLAKMYSSFFFKIMKMGFHPTRENVENYIGWGGAKEAPLPDSVIEQFTISVMNVNPNSAFPKMIQTKQLRSLQMPVLVLLGEKEFAFNPDKAMKIAKQNIQNLTIDMVADASHLIPVSRPEEANRRILEFLGK